MINCFCRCKTLQPELFRIMLAVKANIGMRANLSAFYTASYTWPDLPLTAKGHVVPTVISTGALVSSASRLTMV